MPVLEKDYIPISDFEKKRTEKLLETVRENILRYKKEIEKNHVGKPYT